jgi:outer membrane lipoprotein-sorting protein
MKHRPPHERRARAIAPPFALILALSSTLAAGSTAYPRPPAGELPVAAGESARPIMERMNRAYYYPGQDMRAGVVMQLGEGARTVRTRVMTLLRWNVAPEGDQRYLLYFHQPGDVRRMSCMVWKHVGAPDDRWMFVPLTNRVVRVRSPERSSFLGSEFVREELAGRDVDADTHALIRMETLDGRDCYVVESEPKIVEDFTRYTSWIDRATFLPLRQEFRDVRGEVSRVFTAAPPVEIPSARIRGRSYPVLLSRTMTARPGGRWTTVVMDSVSFDIGLKQEDFSESHLRTPLQDWLP